MSFPRHEIEDIGLGRRNNAWNSAPKAHEELGVLPTGSSKCRVEPWFLGGEAVVAPQYGIAAACAGGMAVGADGDDAALRFGACLVNAWTIPRVAPVALEDRPYVSEKDVGLRALHLPEDSR